MIVPRVDPLVPLLAGNLQKPLPKDVSLLLRESFFCNTGTNSHPLMYNKMLRKDVK
jgi:hypothetical protein